MLQSPTDSNSNFHCPPVSGDSDSKESACNAGDPGLIPRLGKSPGEGNGNPSPAFLPGESHGQRSLKGYSPWGCTESDMTEGLTLSNL